MPVFFLGLQSEVSPLVSSAPLVPLGWGARRHWAETARSLTDIFYPRVQQVKFKTVKTVIFTQESNNIEEYICVVTIRRISFGTVVYWPRITVSLVTSSVKQPLAGFRVSLEAVRPCSSYKYTPWLKVEKELQTLRSAFQAFMTTVVKQCGDIMVLISRFRPLQLVSLITSQAFCGRMRLCFRWRRCPMDMVRSCPVHKSFLPIERKSQWTRWS